MDVHESSVRIPVQLANVSWLADAMNRYTVDRKLFYDSVLVN